MVAAFDKVLKLPPKTEMYPGHEYTVANLNFGTKLEPGNSDASYHLEKCKKLRNECKFTIPTTLGIYYNR